MLRTFVALLALCLVAPSYSPSAQAETVITPRTKRAAPARQKPVPINDDGTDRNLSQPAADIELAPANAGYGDQYSVGSAMRTSRVQLGFELLGSALLYSFQGSFLFTDQIGVNAGIAYYSVSGSATTGTRRTDVKASLTLLPVSLFTLIGGPNHYFEIFGGVTPIITSGEIKENDNAVDRATNSGIFYSAGLGYRYWPVEGGFHFRGNMAVVVVGGVVGIWPGLEFGYAF